MKQISISNKAYPEVWIICILLIVCLPCIRAQDGHKKVVLITGSAMGIGKTSAELLIEEGYIVYGGDILVEENRYLTETGGYPLKMDISKDDEVEAAVEQIIKEQGRIDVLFANAGYNLHGPIECVDIADAQKLFDVNVFGHARCVKAVLPYMREQGSGNIIINSSLGGKISVPGMSWYTSSKYALEAFADALRMEVRQFNISVSVIEPGAVLTGIRKNAEYTLEKAKQSPNSRYYDLKAYEENFKGRSSSGADPSGIANLVLKIIKSKYPERRYMPTLDAKLAYMLHSLFGYGLTDDFLLTKFFGTKLPNPLKRRSLTISADSWPLFNEGYRAGLNYNYGRLSLGLSYFDVIEKSPTIETVSFEENRQGFGASLGTFISDEQRGLNLRLEFNYFTRVSVTELPTDEELEKKLYRAGLHAGYLWQPFKSICFYIEPSVHAGYAFGDRELNFTSGRILKKEGFDVSWPMINVGWKINF